MADSQYGSEVAPEGPVQDMWQIDHLVGGDAQTRDAGPANFTGGTGGAGLGGSAEPMAPGGEMDGTVYERIGF